MTSAPDAGSGGERSVHPLAPMSGLILALTVFVLAIPVLMLALGLSAVALIIVVMCIWVWVWMRPREFVIDEHDLWIVWPWRKRRVPLTRIENARAITGAEFRGEHGLAVRIGIGGLWGGFGLLWTRPATYAMYVSRADGLIIVERSAQRPLLITPERPDAFLARLADR